jgi:uncharacterized protein YndB with AHSA1/START domain
MTAAAIDTTEREIGTTRIFEAPRSLVWTAFSGPEHLANWWGPNGFTTTTTKFELIPGGEWLFTMHGPDGTDYRNEIKFTAVVEPESIEYDHGPSPIFHTTVTFEEEGADRTRLTMTALFPTVAERNRTVEKFGAVEGMKQTINRLGEYLETLG